MKLLTRDFLASCKPFSCGDGDLDDFFMNDATNFYDQLLGKSYCYVLDEDPSVIVCAFTLSNDSLRVDDIPGSRKRRVNGTIPREKHLRRYPAVLIGRLGVNVIFAEDKDLHIGSELMDAIKLWFIQPDNKASVRYLAVDSYNKPRPLHYYEKNGFKYLFSSEVQEAENSGLNIPLATRYMFFDLIDFRARVQK